VLASAVPAAAPPIPARPAKQSFAAKVPFGSFSFQGKGTYAEKFIILIILEVMRYV